MEHRAKTPEFSKREPPPGLNAILGDSAAGTFRQAFHPGGGLIVDQDVLSCGPTPQMPDLGSWRAMRTEFWTTLIPGEEWPAPDVHLDVPAYAARMRQAERINLWCARSLSEQLFVAFAIHLMESGGTDVGKVYLVPFENLRGRNALVLGMGELGAEAMADHPEPRRLTSETLGDYRAAWQAMTSEDPRAFEKFAGTRPNADTWLRRAMHLMLRRFPDKQSGLVHWDHVLLERAQKFEGRTAARVIGATLVDHCEDGDFVGDTWLFGRLLKLERQPRPLLAFTGDRTSMRDCQATLTPFGRDVLEGRASNYPANPIEDWAAGVKLSSSAGTVWLNDGGRLVPA